MRILEEMWNTIQCTQLHNRIVKKDLSIVGMLFQIETQLNITFNEAFGELDKLTSFVVYSC